jgi:crossover junction endodeoxyribonuclease RusA
MSWAAHGVVFVERPMPSGVVLVNLFIPGLPTTQGSKRPMPIYRGKKGAKVFTGKVAMVEEIKHTATWRGDVRDALGKAYEGRPASPNAMAVRLEFVLPRPASTPKTRPTPFATKKKLDIDKMTRAIYDAVTSACCVWADDCQVVSEYNTKRIAEIGEPTGVRIVIEDLEAGCAPDARGVTSWL